MSRYGPGAVGTAGYVISEHTGDSPVSPSKAGDLRLLGGLIVAGSVVFPALPDVGPLCPLRRVTGIPCPFCGMTTGVMAVGRGDVVGAFAANPASLLLIAAVVISFLPFVYGSGPFREAAARVRPTARTVPWLLLPVLWVWQLHRFHHL